MNQQPQAQASTSAEALQAEVDALYEALIAQGMTPLDILRGCFTKLAEELLCRDEALPYH